MSNTKKKNKPKMKTRPEEYKVEYCDVVENYLSQGYSIEATAGQMERDKGTLYNWAKRHPEFKEAMDRGRAKGMLFWERLGIMGAAGKVNGFNASSWIFNMKNRFNWTDRRDLTSDGEQLKTPTVYLPKEDDN